MKTVYVVETEGRDFLFGYELKTHLTDATQFARLEDAKQHADNYYAYKDCHCVVIECAGYKFKRVYTTRRVLGK